MSLKGCRVYRRESCEDAGGGQERRQHGRWDAPEEEEIPGEQGSQGVGEGASLTGGSAD